MARQLDIIDIEMWRDIPGCDGNYQASSHGRIRGRRGPLKQAMSEYGYVRVSIRLRKKSFTRHVHRLVAAAFIGPAPAGLQVNHINHIRHDNRAQNLEYVTAKQNCQHRRKNGTYPTGENNGRARLTREQVADIRRRRAEGEKLRVLAQEFGVHQNTVWWITKRLTWSE